jgi:RNase P protein component
MDRNVEIKERLELALRLEKPPTLEEVLERVSTRGVLRGPVDWVFPAWMLYVEYATQRIIETFQLSEGERSQLSDFRDAMKRLLREAWTQAKEKLTTLYKAVAEGTYRSEGNKLYAPDGTWMYVRKGFAPYIIIHGISASARFPDVLKLPHERLELLQLGWRASDEGNDKGRPFMGTAQPWQLFAWVATRYGELRVYVTSVNLTHEGASVLIHIVARSWRQKWNKNEAVDLVISHLRHGEWAPLLTMWLGDGKAKRKRVLRSKYEVIIIAKEPWKLGIRTGAREALVAAGKEAFERLREAAGVYGALLDLTKAHKWIEVKLATDKDFRAAYKLKARKRNIDVLRETYRRNNGEIPTVLHAKKPRRGAVTVEGVAMYLHLANSRNGSLLAEYYTYDLGKALVVAERLESAGLRPNVVRSGPKYVVYIAIADLLRLAEKDGEIRRAIALYLAEKAKNGTPRQREIVRKLLQRYPFLYQYLFVSSKPTSPRVSQY